MSNKKKNKDKSKKEKKDLILLVGDVLDEKYKKLTEEIFLMQEEVKREHRKENKRAYTGNEERTGSIGSWSFYFGIRRRLSDVYKTGNV